MTSNNLCVDNYSLKFIFNEDIYLIKDSTSFASSNSSSEANSSTQKDEKKIIQVQPSNKKIAVIATSQNEFKQYEELVIKILQSIGVAAEQAEFISNDNPSSKNSLYTNYLIFGLDNQKLTSFKSSMFLNQTIEEENQKYLFTYSLPELEKSKDKKKGLWTALQTGFLK